MADYTSKYKGDQIDEAVGKALNGGAGSVSSVNGQTGDVQIDIPNVPSWAMQSAKPTYTAAEVGALPSSYTPPNQTASQVGADPAGSANTAVSAHNTDGSAHNDIRALIESLTQKLNALADCDDATLDQMSEVVAYIKNNKSIIDGIATSKVNVTDIINNLTTNVTNKPLSAAQGVAIKKLIDAIVVPTKVSALENDSGYLDSSALSSAISAALVQAKESGEFKGDPGKDGKTPEPGVDYWTDADKAEIVEDVKESGVLMEDDLLQETDYTIEPYTNMLDRYGTAARSALNRNGSTYEATWNVWVSNYFPVRKGQKVYIKLKDGATFKDDFMFALYDENKTFHDDYHIAIYLSAITANPTIYGTLTINGSYAVWDTSTISYGGWAGFAYARIMYVSTDCVITVDEEITDEVQTVYELKPVIKVPKGNLSFDVAEKPLVGKTIVGFGDSLFGQVRDETSALYQVGQITGANVINVGFGGTSAAKVGSGAFAQFSLPALMDAIISGTWTNQDSNVTAATGWSEQLPKLKDINFSSVDIVILHYGTNDFMSAYALEGSAVTSVCGGLRYSIDKLITKYPQIKVYVSLPCYRYWGSAGAYVYPDTYTNTNGAKLTDFVEGIRKVAAEYNFPVIDGYHGLGVNKVNAAHYLKDQTHHSVAGMKLFGEYIAAQLTSQQASAKSAMDTEAVNDLIAAAIGSAIGGSY